MSEVQYEDQLLFKIDGIEQAVVLDDLPLTRNLQIFGSQA